MKRGDGSETSTADDGDAPPLRLDAAPCLAVICGSDELLLTGTNLQCERALPRLGQELVRLEPPVDLGGETETIEPARRENDSVEPALASLAQARVDVPSQRLDRELGLEREQLRASPYRRCPDPQSRPQLRDTAEGVARILALQIGADDEAVGVGRRHVLRRVHRDVDPPAEQRLLELLHEDAARADLAERPRAIAVAGGRDRNERDLDSGPSQLLRGDAGLSEREPTAAGADTNEHGTSTSGALAARTSSAAAEHARRRSAPEGGAACR